MAYSENELRAETKLRGKKLQLTGVVKDIGESLFTKHPFVVLSGSPSPWSVQCLFDRKDRPQIEMLQVGQEVRITGTVSGNALMNVLMEDCFF